jgi:hypothetical protein
MIMHHNALCTPCIALINYDNLLHMRWITWSRRQKFKCSKSDGCSEVHKHQVAMMLTLL